MNNRLRFIVLVFIVLNALFALFMVVRANVRDEDDVLAFLPVILNITGTPQPTPTATPTTAPVLRHFDNCAFRTGNNATVAVPVDVNIIGDLVLAVDDEIAIFTPDGSICAGMTPWNGKNIAVTAWGDDSQTEEVDGLRDGEQMQFRIWDKSEDEEIQVKEITYAVGNGIYMSNGIFAVNLFILD